VSHLNVCVFASHAMLFLWAYLKTLSAIAEVRLGAK